MPIGYCPLCNTKIGIQNFCCQDCFDRLYNNNEELALVLEVISKIIVRQNGK
jgi:hypothetical protein